MLSICLVRSRTSNVYVVTFRGICRYKAYMHHRDDLVEHRTREASFGAQYTNHSANSMRFIYQFINTRQLDWPSLLVLVGTAQRCPESLF